MKKYIVLLILFLLATNLYSVDYIKIRPNVWIHVSYYNYNGTMTPSNGLIVKTKNGTILIDTAWDDIQTKEICDFIRNELKSNILLCIITHAHIDRLGGVGYLNNQKINVYMTNETKRIALDRQYNVGFSELDIGNEQFEKYGLNIIYYGPAHSHDNIVVYLKNENVLFAGCLIKSIDSTNLGNLDDADITNWKIVNSKLEYAYIDSSILIVPGHGNYGSIELFKHMDELLNN